MIVEKGAFDGNINGSFIIHDVFEYNDDFMNISQLTIDKDHFDFPKYTNIHYLESNIKRIKQKSRCMQS